MLMVAQPVGAGVGSRNQTRYQCPFYFYFHHVALSQDKVLRFGCNDYNGGNKHVPEPTERECYSVVLSS